MPAPGPGPGLEEAGAKSRDAAAVATLTLARAFRRNREWGQAIPRYEEFIAGNPDSPDLPYALLELGRTYAQSGATEAALSRFYSVLDLALNREGTSLVKAREVSYTAQYEIALTRLELGQYAQAARLFRGMRQLPLIEVDRANVYFHGARALKLAGDKAGAAEDYRAFLELFSDTAVAAEARFERAVLLAELGRREEAAREVVALLAQPIGSGGTEESWRHWQRRAGNHLANLFYSAGDFAAATKLYDQLLPLSEEARWRWPLMYQRGLAAEQLKDFAKARQIFGELAAVKAGDLPEEVAELPQRAQWRLQHLDWALRIDSELKGLKQGP